MHGYVARVSIKLSARGCYGIPHVCISVMSACVLSMPRLSSVAFLTRGTIPYVTMLKARDSWAAAAEQGHRPRVSTEVCSFPCSRIATIAGFVASIRVIQSHASRVLSALTVPTTHHILTLKASSCGQHGSPLLPGPTPATLCS
jgi:hypothetical protein